MCGGRQYSVHGAIVYLTALTATTMVMCCLLSVLVLFAGWFSLKSFFLFLAPLSKKKTAPKK